MRKFITAILFFCIAAFSLLTSCAHSPNRSVGTDESQEKLDKAFDKAVYDNNLNAMRKYLKAGANPNRVSSLGWGELTFLSIFTDNYYDQIDEMEILFEYGADANIRNSDGRTAVFYARNTRVLRFLVSHGARLDIVDNKGTSPLMRFIEWGSNGQAEFIMDWEQEHSPDFSAGFESRKDYYTAALNILLFKKPFSNWDSDEEYAFAERLLNAGADPNAKNDKGRNPAFWERYRGVQIFASFGTRFDIVDNEGTSPLMNYIKEGMYNAANSVMDWEEKNSPGFTAGFNSRKDYHTAILKLVIPRYWSSEEKISLVKRLLDSGASATIRNDQGIPIVLWDKSEYSDVIRLLIENGAPVDELDPRDNTTLLMRAVENNLRNGLVEYLLAHGADPNKRNSAGKTSLMTDYSHEPELLGTVLLKYGADPNLQDNEGKTALMHNRQIKYISLLLQSGADPTIKDNKGKTVLHYWSYRGGLNKELLEELVTKGCDPDEPDIDGMSPLMYAAQGRERESISALLEKGADPNRKNSEGRTALHLYLLELEKRAIGGQDNYKPIPTALLSAGTRPADTDNEGDSALITMLRISKNKYSNKKTVKELEKLVLQYASADEIRVARTPARKAVAKERMEDFSEDLPTIIGASIAPLVVGGLSIWMREGAYANNPSGNFMVPLNSMFTMGVSCMIAGSLTGLFTGLVLGAGWGSLVTAVLGEVAGLITGVIIANRPSIQNAFRNNPLCYYAPTAWFALTATIRIVSGHGPEFPLLLALFNNR